jgi:L-threonylcarbamoyladenylate synthase
VHPLVIEAARLIREGKLVAFPTETVYGLGANALDAAAVQRIFEAKGRPSTSPLIVHVASIEMGRGLAAEWPEQAERLASAFWPGPLTLVLPKRPVIPDNVTAGLATVGLRMPAHPIALDLIREAGVPVAAPSANRFTELSPTEAAHVENSLGGAVDLVIDGGPTQVGIESTVLSLSGTPAIVRPGMVTKPEIEALIGPVGIRHCAPAGANEAPGMRERHYRPRTPLFFEPQAAGSGVYLYRTAPAAATRSLPMPDNPAAYGAELYRILHQLDTEGLDWIAVEPPPDEPYWAGIRDRLQRAANC